MRTFGNFFILLLVQTYYRKANLNFKQQWHGILGLKKKIANLWYQIIPLVFSFILVVVFCDTLDSVDSFAVEDVKETPPKEKKMRGNLLLLVENLLYFVLGSFLSSTAARYFPCIYSIARLCYLLLTLSLCNFFAIFC